MANNTQKTGNQENFGPRKVSNYHVFTRTISGIFGGITGTVMLVLTLLLASNIFAVDNELGQEVAKSLAANLDAERSELNLFIVVAGVLFATLTAHIIYLLGLVLFDREQYKNFVVSIIQVLIVDILVFVFTLPAYLLIGTFDIEKLAFVVGIHIMVSTLISSFVIDLINRQRYVMVGFYGITLGLVLGVSFELIFALTLGAERSVLGITILTMLPVLLASVGFFSGLFEMMYNWVFSVYGIDWLGGLRNYEEVEIEVDEDTDMKEED